MLIIQAVHEVMKYAYGQGYKKAVKVISPECVVTAARRHKPGRRDLRAEVVITIGKPNYAMRAFIKQCKKVGEPFPVKKVQLKVFPMKKKK